MGAQSSVNNKQTEENKYRHRMDVGVNDYLELVTRKGIDLNGIERIETYAHLQQILGKNADCASIFSWNYPLRKKCKPCEQTQYELNQLCYDVNEKLYVKINSIIQTDMVKKLNKLKMRASIIYKQNEMIKEILGSSIYDDDFLPRPYGKWTVREFSNCTENCERLVTLLNVLTEDYVTINHKIQESQRYYDAKDTLLNLQSKLVCNICNIKPK